MTGDKGDNQIISIKDANFVCRYEDNFNSAPNCPLGFCSDAPCNTCTKEYKPKEKKDRDDDDSESFP